MIDFNKFLDDPLSNIFKKENMKMANKFTVRAFDTKTQSEIESARIGFSDINDREHYGRKLITMAVDKGGNEYEHQNIGILNPDGSVESQPGYEFKVERD